MLNDEQGSAANIKSRQTRQSVLTAITSTRERLKLYSKTPKNGLILFCGTILLEDGKTEKKITYDFEPYRSINTFMYKCDNKFHADPLK
jgi:peptide chain release factor subunit 1